MSRSFLAAATALLVPAIVLTVGCKKPGVEGKWQGTVQKMSTTMEFMADGQFKQSTTAPMAQIEATGTYKVTGENITITIADAKAGGRSVIAMLPPAMKQQSGTWKRDGDKLNLTVGTGTVELTAMKP